METPNRSREESGAIKAVRGRADGVGETSKVPPLRKSPGSESAGTN
jgi:hypothetical protein